MPTMGTVAGRWLMGLLSHRQLGWRVAAIAALFALPSLWAGFSIDDWWHRLFLLGIEPHAGSEIHSAGMFAFVDGDPVRTHRLMDLGILPWWTWPELEAAFVRPLAALTHRLDYALWPDSAVLMHAHNVLWFVAAMALAAHLYRRLIGPTWVAGAAALLYAVDDGRGPLVGWIANRNALIALTFGLAALAAHLGWRRDGRIAGAVLGPGLLLAGLLSGESAIGVAAYLFAYAVYLDRGSVWRRCGTLVPYVAVALLWWVVNRQLGYGMEGTDVYIDPLAHPLRFAAAVVDRAPILLLGQWALPPASLHLFMSPTAVAALQIAGVMLTALLAHAMIGLWRQSAVARFWTLGMGLALLPICATFPHERLLSFVGLGAMGLLALFLQAASAGTRCGVRRHPPRGTPRWRWLRGPLIAVHGVLAPLSFVPASWQNAVVGRVMAADADGLPAGPSVASQDWVFVSSAIPFLQGYLPIVRTVRGEPVPAHLRTLAPSSATLEITRDDAHTLTIRAREGFLTAPLDDLFRDRDHPLRVGQVVRLTGCTITVQSTTGDERPRVVRFRFDEPLESRRLVWFVHREGRLLPFAPPRIGETTVLAPEPLVPFHRLVDPWDR